MSSDFDLFLFATERRMVEEADSAGVDGFIVDWESAGKDRRQAGADTEVNHAGPEDLIRVRRATSRRVICRIDPAGPETALELEIAAECGADEVLLPMVRSPREVWEALELADGRVGVGIMVETVEAVRRADELGALPITRAYVGLNDLAIERGSKSIFEAVADRTVERIRGSFDVPFGFAGITRPDRGAPIPCRLLIAELRRLGCSFSFLRRSFRRDVPAGGCAEAVAAIRVALAEAKARDEIAVLRDYARLRATLDSVLDRPKVAI
jgi:HpcH/HpaI aldolase/citrate lyase family